MNDHRDNNFHDFHEFHQFVDSAWATYRDQLGAFVSEMPFGERLEITAESGLDRGDGETPWIRIESTVDDALVSTAVLACHLYDGVDSPAGDDRALVELGWATPAERDVVGLVSRAMQCSRRDSDDLAQRIVSAFRDVWHVAHPAFLSAHAEGGNGRQFRTEADSRQPDSTAVLPLDIDHLRALIRHTLAERTKLEVSTEEGGDIAVGGFHLPIHVCFGHDATAVRLHAPLVTGVQHSQATSRRISWLTTRWKGMSFVVAGGQLFAEIDLATQTFVPRHLTHAVFSLGLFVGRIDTAFASALGGTVFDPTHTHPDPLPKVSWSDDCGTLGTLRAACELTGGPVDTATVEALCRTQDLAELTERARWSADRFRGHAHRLGDERRIRAAVLCDTFAAAWEDVSESLQRAARPKSTAGPRGEQIQLFEHLDELALFDM